MSSDPCNLNDTKNEFVSVFGLSEEAASILAVSGYCSIEDISCASVEELKGVCGIDNELLESVLAIAKKYVAEADNQSSLGKSNDREN